VEPDPIEIPEPSIPQVPAAGTAPEVISEHSVDDSALAVENETPPDVDATETAMEDESQPEPPAAPQPAQPGNQGESVEREMKQPVVAEPDAAAAEPVEAETEAVEVGPLKPENEIEPAAATATAVPPENESPVTGTSAVNNDLASTDRLAAISLENEPVPGGVPSEAVVEPEETAQDSSGTKPILIPQLTVVPRKLPSTESVPFEVVTLNQESKVKPEEVTTTEVVEVEPEEPGPASEPEALPTQQRNEQEEAATVTSEQQPVLTTPAKIAEAEATPEPVQTTTAPRKNPDIYYAERLAAGSRWLVGGSSQKYTVQLMVLNAEDAQDNVRDMLVEDGYQSIMDKLYILKKSGQPQTVMLYYGEFDSSAEARQAKTQLPSFLDKLEPYELAVREAVAKARAGQ